MKLDEATIEATVHDGEGPPLRRRLMAALAAAAFVPCLLVALSSMGHMQHDWVWHGLDVHVATVQLSIVGVVLALLARVIPPRSAARRTTVLCAKGRVRLTGAGLLNRTLRAKDVTGATTARRGEALVLTLALKGRESSPLHLEFASLSSMRAVCDALGIGHHGFGVVGFGLRARPVDVAETVARVITAACYIVALFQPNGLAAVGATLGILVSLVLWGARRAPPPQLVMTPDGMRLWGALQSQQTPQTPYAAIQSVGITKQGLTIEGPSCTMTIAAPPSRFLPDGMSAAEREILAAQLTAASMRAHGGNALKEEAPSTLELLRRHGDRVADWLARVDGVAAAFGVGAGYRGGTFDLHDLWRAFEDPDGDAELRTAAGRVLMQAAPEEMKVRVSPVLETVRDEGVKKRIAVGLQADPARAEQELLALEALEKAQQEELAAAQQMAMRR